MIPNRSIFWHLNTQNRGCTWQKESYPSLRTQSKIFGWRPRRNLQIENSLCYKMTRQLLLRDTCKHLENIFAWNAIKAKQNSLSFRIVSEILQLKYTWGAHFIHCFHIAIQIRCGNFVLLWLYCNVVIDTTYTPRQVCVAIWWIIILSHTSWCRQQMETFSALLAICAGHSPVFTKASDTELWCFLWSASD